MRFQCRRPGAPLLPVLYGVALSISFIDPFLSSAAAETRLVRRGDSLQQALNAAQPGDLLLLEPGAVYSGNFTLPVKAGETPIVVRTAPSPDLPPPGRRIQPAHSPLLARIQSPNNAAAMKTAAGAHHWTLEYLEFGPNEGGYGDIIQLGDGSRSQNTLASVPRHLVLGHVYIRGDRLLGQKRAIALNAAHVTIRDSYIADIKGVGIDTQAIGGWNGPGPYVIENNYLEAAGENFLLGGADPAIAGLVPEGITFRRNHVARPWSWREPIIPSPQGVVTAVEAGGSLSPGTYAYRVLARRPVGQGTIGRSTVSAEAVAVVAAAGAAVRISWQPVPHATEYRVYGRMPGGQTAYWTAKGTTFIDTGAGGMPGAVPTGAGTVWSVKNLFELKNARNVTVHGNIFENHWMESQPGYAIVLTPRNSNGACTWCVVERVSFENNVIRHVAAAVNIIGYDAPSRPTQQTREVSFRNNLFYDIGGEYGGNAWFMQVGDEPKDIWIDHNTIAHTGTAIVYAYGGTSASPRRINGFRFTNNAVRHNKYGINGTFFAYGEGILSGYFPGAAFAGNFISGASRSRYPAATIVSGSFEAQFADVAQGDFRLQPGSALRAAATDGGDIGADMGTLLVYTGAVELGEGGVPFLPPPVNLRIVSAN